MNDAGVVVDANLLVLLVIGQVRPDLIGRHRRLREFEPSDHPLLVKTIRSFTKVIVTPNAATEASNLMGHGSDSVSTSCSNAFGRFLSNSAEIYIPSSQLVLTAEFIRFGLTDAGLFHLASTGNTVLTKDAPLCAAISWSGGRAINFDHLRGAGLMA